MISDVLLTMLVYVMDTIRGFFPDGAPLGFVVEAGNTFAEFFGSHAGPLDRWIPVHEMAFVMGIELTVIGPALLAYELANWVFRHIPWVAAGG